MEYTSSINSSGVVVPTHSIHLAHSLGITIGLLALAYLTVSKLLIKSC